MAEAATKIPLKTEKPETSAGKPPATWRPFESLHQEIDRLFDEFSRDWPRLTLPRPALPFYRGEVELKVASEVTEDEKEYRVTVEIPGLDEKDVEVNLSNSALKIKGEKKSEREETKKDYRLSERSYGSFERYFALPDNVDAEKIEATMKAGVLTVVLPKTAEARKKTRKVAVKAA
jgi:HSP20 family protein